MKISIVTPCFDRAKFLDETIRSVIFQKGDFDIQYIIQVSGNDAEVDRVLSKWELSFAEGIEGINCNNLEFLVVREDDRNMYDGLNRGFEKANGDLFAWINSDDLYHNGAFQTVVDIASNYSDVYWLSGIPNSFNSVSSRTGYDKEPPVYSREFIRRGYYRIENLNDGFNWIAQDSCFWRRDLWNAAGSRLDDTKGLAADFYLWMEFARHADLVKVNSFLGGYRFHGDQFTGDPDAYLKYLPDLRELPKNYRMLRNLTKRYSSLRRLLFNRRRGSPFLPLCRIEWDWLIGRRLEWSFEEDRWKIYHHPIF